MTRSLLPTALAAALVFAAPVVVFAASEKIDEKVAAAHVQTLGSEALAAFTQAGVTPAQKEETFTKLMLKNIDFAELSTRVMGPAGPKATPADRHEFTRLFAAYFINTVNEMLKGLDVTSFTVGRVKVQPNQEVIVDTSIQKSDGQTIEAGWRLQSTAGVLKVVDVYVQGASAAGHFQDRMKQSTQTSVKGQNDRLKQVLANSPTLQVVSATMK
ncbi:MAG: ABC transporter substrate-binding protein [Alphaproteobacteria bacterium]